MSDLDWLLLENKPSSVVVLDGTNVRMTYRHPNGSLYLADVLEWLSLIPDQLCDLVVVDPPYGMGKIAWDRWDDRPTYLDWLTRVLRCTRRCLRGSGSLFLFGYPEVIADVRFEASKLFNSCRWLTWHYRNRANLSGDWGRSQEAILHLRTKGFQLQVDAVREPYSQHTLRYPERSQGLNSCLNASRTRWKPHPRGSKPKDVIEVPVISNGGRESTPHPTQKPEELIRKLILSSTRPGDLVLDPFFGSGTTPVCSEQLQRRWMACDRELSYHDLAIKRIKAIHEVGSEYWLNRDRESRTQRDRIRYGLPSSMKDSNSFDPPESTREADLFDLLGFETD